MLAALLLIGLQKPDGIRLDYSPAPKDRYEISQSSYAIQDGSLVEKITFEFNVATKKIDAEYECDISRKLVEHVFGGEKLDLPFDNQPLKLVELRDANGMVQGAGIDLPDADSYRLDRLTCYMPPKTAIKLGESWQRTLAWPEDVALPKIRYRYTLQSLTTSSAKIGVTVEEIETNNPLKAAGTVTVSRGEGKQRLLTGQWTSESAFMPGGSEERYRLVQRLKSLPIR